jgi:ureidoglycolate hydrolase
MNTIDVPLKRLDANVFKPYGLLLEPHWQTERFLLQERMVALGFGLAGSPEMYMMRYYENVEGVLSRFERHHRVTETRVSLGEPTVIVVAGDPAQDGPDSLPDPETVRAFLLEPNHGIMFRRSTWHSRCFPVRGKYADFLLFSEKATEDELFGDKHHSEWKRTQILDYADESAINFRVARHIK